LLRDKAGGIRLSASRRLTVAAVSAASTMALLGMAALPNASAAECTVVVTLATGQKLYFHLPPGVSPSTLNLPPGVVSIHETCPKTSSPTTTKSKLAPNTHRSPSPAKKSAPATKPKPKLTPPPRHPGTGQSSPTPSSPSSHNPSSPSSSHPSKSSHPSSPSTRQRPTQQPNGIPTPTNPSFSLALPNPAQIGVPNFFIQSFAIPPFLLPIYQAAGIQYDVPWQVLAAINEIETDYGRNLSVSSAGAVGWMQFLPSTWKKYAVDATGSGYADPYNPVDAIFTAARYLNAAGASKNLSQAIFAYNHAQWYVQSVLLRAKLIGGMPNSLIGALTGLVEGHFPVAAPARYADDYVQRLLSQQKHKSNAAGLPVDNKSTPAVPVSSNPNEKSIAIYAKHNSPVIAVNDGKVVKIGSNRQWGRYLELQDSNGNVYTYAHLGSVPSDYPVPKPVPVSAAGVVKALATPSSPKPRSPATAGSQNGGNQTAAQPPSVPLAPAPRIGGKDAFASQTGPATPTSFPAPQVKQRLFAYPSRPASYAAGGALQLQSEQAQQASQQIQNFQNYFSGVLHLAKNQYTLKPLKTGAIVVAGTILGRIGPGTNQQASHLQFMIKPAGKNAPYIDPKPILDGWELLQATSIYRASGVNPFLRKNPSIGQLLLMSKRQLQQRVLADPRVQIYPCGRRDVATGQIDRRILADMEFLSASGLKPYISGLKCGATPTASNGIDPAGQSGASMDISKINNIPISGHQGPGSITDITIRRLLTLQGAFKPTEIVSLISFKGQSSTISLPDHKNRIQVSYTPMFGSNKALSAQVTQILKPQQWIQLIQRLGQIPEPTVPINPSKYAIKAHG
jgi:Transglycosylase SLT domain/Peptidase family M23